MSTRVTINIGFYFQNQHYAQLQGYIPRAEALNIPLLRLDRQERVTLPEESNKPKQGKSESKKESEQEMSQEEENNVQNEMDLENEDNDLQNEEDNEMDAEQQNEVERALEELEQDHYDEQQSSEEEDDEDDDDDDDIDIDSLSNPSPMKGYNSNKTKRQKGQTKDLVQLPDRRPRKDKKLDEASEIIRREEKERKRKQYLKKQVEAQQKATLQKILNETGRKLRLRQQKEIQEEMEREQKVFRSLGDVPKVITMIGQQGKQIMLHKTPLFPPSMTQRPDIKMKDICSACGRESKYKLRGGKLACSLPCYKILT